MAAIAQADSAPWTLWAQRVGVFGLCLFLLFSWLGTALGYLGLGLMMIALLASLPRTWAMIKAEPMLWLFLLFGIYLLLRTSWAVAEFPELAALHINDASMWLQLWLFMLVGWWQYQNRHRIYLALGLVLIGFVLSVVRLTDWDACSGFLESARCGFGFQVIMGGLLASSALLGLVMFAPKLIGPQRRRAVWLLRGGLWFVLLLIAIQLVISTQTRSAWLALAVLLPPLLVVRYWQSVRGIMNGENKPGLILGVVALLCVAGIISVNKGVFSERLLHVKENVAEMMLSQFDRVEVGNEAVGGRLFMTKAGIDVWLQRPIFGWGTGVNAVEHFPDMKQKIGGMTHLHNTYVELLVRLGLVGAGFYLLAVVLVGQGICRAYRSGQMERDVWCFLVGILGMLMIWCFTDYQLQSTDWRFYWYVMLGFALSYALGQRRAGKGPGQDRGPRADADS